MAITFTGGQSMPTFGTPAYNAMVAPSTTTPTSTPSVNPGLDRSLGGQTYQSAGGQTYDQRTGALYTPPTGVNSPVVSAPAYSPVKATQPVVTSSAAYDDYQAKLATWNSLNQAVTAQTDAKNKAEAQAKADQAASTLNAAEMNLKQQDLDRLKAESDAKMAAVKAATGVSSEGNQGASNQNAAQPSLNAPEGNIAGGTPSPADRMDQSNQGYAQSMQGIMGAKDQLTQSWMDNINQLRNGTIPLTGPQNALLTSMQTQLAQRENEQRVANSAYTGAVTMAGFRAGGEYTPAQYSGQIANAISYGTAKIQELDSNAATTMAKLTTEFQQQNYDNINKGFELMMKQLDDKAAAITKMHDNVVSTIKDERNYQLDVAKFNEQTAKDAQSLAQSKYEFRDLKDAVGTTIGTQVYDKSTGKVVSSSYNAGQTNPSTGVTTPTVTTNTDGTVNKDSQYATLQAVVPKPYQALVWQIVNGKGDAPNTRTAAGQKLAAWVAQVDPTLSDGSGGFDATKYQARLTMQKSLASNTGGSLGSGLNAANKVIAHLDEFQKSVSSLPNSSQFSTLNSINKAVVSPLAAEFGFTGLQENQAKASQVALGLSDEMAKFFKGTGASDVESIKGWSKGLDVNAPLGSMRGTVQGTLDLFSGQLNTFTQQYTNVMGHAPDFGTILQPQTVSILSGLKNQGYDIKIPGIYYTDKGVWMKNGGSQDSWNGAVDLLTQKGIPLTEENILQTAQVINE